MIAHSLSLVQILKCWSCEAMVDGRGAGGIVGRSSTDGCFSICWLLAAVTDVFLPSESLMVCLPLLRVHDSNTIYTSPIWHRIKSFFISLLFVDFLVNNQQPSPRGSLLNSTRFLTTEECPERVASRAVLRMVSK